MNDFEKLKRICEESGFELVNESPKENDKFYVVRKKDEWEGVGFAKALLSHFNDDLNVSEYTAGRIYRVKSIKEHRVFTDFDDKGSRTNGWDKKNFQPSTESEYVEQLKKEAFDRFGEIKEGDRFKRDYISVSWGCEEVIGKSPTGGFEFYYDKNSDILYKGNLAIYKQGKWAEKIDVVKVIDWKWDWNIGQIARLSFDVQKWGMVEYKKEVMGEIAELIQNLLNEKRT